MLKIDIKTIWGSVFFSYEKEDNNIKDTVREMLKEYTGKLIEYVDLSGMDLSGVDFTDSSFTRSSFTDSSFTRSSFTDSSFTRSSFTDSSFTRSSFTDSSFTDSSFTRSSFTRSSFTDSSFTRSSFTRSSFTDSSFTRSSFTDSSFTRSRFDNDTIKNIREAGQLKMFNDYRNDLWAILLYAQNEIPALIVALNSGNVDGSTYSGSCACLVGTIANARHCDYESLITIKPDSNRPAEQWFMQINSGDTPDKSEVAKLTIEWVEEFAAMINQLQSLPH